MKRTFRWAKYNHKGMFHSPQDDTTPQFEQTHTLCGVLLNQGKGRNPYMAYIGRGTDTSCKRCLNRLQNGRK